MRFMLNIGGRISLVGRRSLPFLGLIGWALIVRLADVDEIDVWL